MLSDSRWSISPSGLERHTESPGEACLQVYIFSQIYFRGNYCTFPSLNRSTFLCSTTLKGLKDLQENIFIVYCKYSPGRWNLAFTNGKKQLDIIMFVVQLSPPCNYRASPGLNSDEGGLLDQD